VPPPERPPAGRRVLLGCAAAIAVVLIVAVALALLLSIALRNGNAVVEASGGRITSFHAFTNGPKTSVTFVAARGIDLPDGPGLACDVVRPVLAQTGWAAAEWTIVNRAGDVIASDQTPCP
jgi:hypothetical protein